MRRRKGRGGEGGERGLYFLGLGFGDLILFVLSFFHKGSHT